MDLFYVLIVVLAGACAPTQAGINSQLREYTGDPVIAATFSFAVGTAGLLAYVLLLRTSWPPVQVLTQVPWWMWSGGFLGAFLVTVTIILAPTLGAATLMACLVAGQMTASLLLDHYGLVGFEEHSVNVPRLLGAAFLVVGVVLIKRF